MLCVLECLTPISDFSDDIGLCNALEKLNLLVTLSGTPKPTGIYSKKQKIVSVKQRRTVKLYFPLKNSSNDP